MTTSVNVNRQTILVAEREFSYTDFTSGVAKPLIYVKPGTRILRGFVDVTTAFSQSEVAAMAITVGDTEGSDSVNRYLGSTTVTAAALTPLVVPIHDGVIDTAEAITATLTVTTGTASAGAGILVVEYVESERSTEYNTYRG